MNRIGVIGGGAWGTALAASARRAGRDVVLWAREGEVVSAITDQNENALFLPGVELDPAIRATGDLSEACEADAILLACPAQHLRATSEQIAAAADSATLIAVCSKGIEQGSLKLMSEVLAETLPKTPIAILSGPTFAREVAEDRPTAVTLACEDKKLGASLIAALGHAHFRPYLSGDVIGAQIGGAVKNVLAIASGIVDGNGLGDNAAAALITRGLAEIMRLGLAMGARSETLMGLSGLGDLVLTCTSRQSRNMSLGAALGEGRQLGDILGERVAVTEGVYTAEAVVALAGKHKVEMPICEAMDRVLNQGAALAEEIERLLSRPFKAETS